MSDPSSRRNFLRGRVSVHAAQPRPPWARAEAEFTRLCSRCGDCARACPTRIIRQGDGGFPTVDFALGECTFCGDCVAVCPTSALVRGVGERAWELRAGIADACLARRRIECRICGEQCGEGAIRFPPLPGGPAQPVIDSDKCTGCGACVAPCPVGAVTVSRAP